MSEEVTFIDAQDKSIFLNVGKNSLEITRTGVVFNGEAYENAGAEKLFNCLATLFFGDHSTPCQTCESIYTQAAEKIEELEKKLEIAVEALRTLASDDFIYQYVTSDQFMNVDEIRLKGGLFVAKDALKKIEGLK